MNRPHSGGRRHRFASLATLLAALLSLACSSTGGETHPEINPTFEQLRGLWLHVEEDGTERVWSFQPKDDGQPATLGQGRISSVCLKGELVQRSRFTVEEGHIVETVLEDAEPANVGKRFGTEVLGLEGDTLVMESASHPSGRRTWKRIARYLPRGASGWSAAAATTPVPPIYPLGATDLVFDADGDWHLVTSEQAISSIPGGPSLRPAVGMHAHRKNGCAVRTEPMPAFHSGGLVLREGVLTHALNRLDFRPVLATRPVDDGLSGFVEWSEEPLAELSTTPAGGLLTAADGTLVLLRQSPQTGEVRLWRRPIGGGWSSKLLPALPLSRLVLDAAGRANWLMTPGFADMQLISEQADGTFATETIPGTDPNGPPKADLAAAPDGSLRIVTGFDGMRLFQREGRSWRSTRLSTTPSDVGLEIDPRGVHHLWSRLGGQLLWARWDGTTLLRELPALAASANDRPFIRFGPDGQVALGLSPAVVAIRPADAEARRRNVKVKVKLTFIGDGTVRFDGQPTPCRAPGCTLTLPAGTLARFTVEPGAGHVLQGLRLNEQPMAQPPLEPFSGPDGTGGHLPVGSADQEATFVFTRSPVLALKRVEPAGVTFQKVGPGLAGTAGIAGSATAGWTVGTRTLTAGPFLGALDAEGRFRWARPLPPGLVVAQVKSLPGGDLLVTGTFTGTLDLDGRTLTSTAPQGGPSGVVVRLASADGTAKALLSLGAGALPFDVLGLSGGGWAAVFQSGSALTLAGKSLPEGSPALATFDAADAPLAAQALDTASGGSSSGPARLSLAATADRLFLALNGVGLVSLVRPGAVERLAAFERATLRPLWSRLPFVDGLDRVATTPDGRVVAYGPSRGGDYGDGERPNPSGPGQPNGAVLLLFSAEGALQKAHLLPLDQKPLSLDASDTAAHFAMGLGRPISTQIALADGVSSSTALATLQPGAPVGTTTVLASAWQGDRLRLWANQRGVEDWTLVAGSWDGALVVDGR